MSDKNTTPTERMIAMLQEKIATLTAERDEARSQSERWEDDALRLMKERNKAEKERDEARREVCRWAAARYRSEFQHYSTVNAIDYAEKRGWRDSWRDGQE